MPSPVNPVRYPTLYMYLARLPQGIASHPQAQCLADMAQRVRHRWPDLGDRPDLPPDVRECLIKPWTQDQWIPETSFMAYHALIRDVIFRNDVAFLKYCYDVSVEHYSSKLMRAVMHFVSPALLVMGASRKWATMKRGTTLQILKNRKDGLTAQLTYPPNLYHNCMLDGLAQTFRAGIDGTKATSCSVEAQPISPQECQFHLKWTFD